MMGNGTNGAERPGPRGLVEDAVTRIKNAAAMAKKTDLRCDCGCLDMRIEQVFGVMFDAVDITDLSIEPRQRMYCADCGLQAHTVNDPSGKPTHWAFERKESLGG